MDARPEERKQEKGQFDTAEHRSHEEEAEEVLIKI